MIKANFLRAAVLATVMVSPAALAQGPGYGYGPGMMGGGMMSGPMMGGGPGYGRGPLVAALNLSDEQREKIFAVQEENRRKTWDTMGQMRAEMFRLRSMSFADKIDAKVYSEQQKKVDDLRRQIIASRIESRNQIEQILTPEQRKQFRSFGPWWLQDDE